MNNLTSILNSGGEKFVQFALPMLIQSSILIVILLAVDLLLRKKVRATFRYWLWMLVLVKLILPPTFSSPVSFGRILGDKIAAPVTNSSAIVETKAPAEPLIIKTLDTSGQEKAIATRAPIPADTPVSVLAAVAADNTGGSALSWQAIVLVVWAGAAGAMVLLVIQRLFFVLGLIRQAQPAQGLLTETLEFCRKRMSVNLPIRLKVSANATSPAVCGLFRPVILVPQDIGPSLGAGHLRPVLMHELGHIKRGDLWVNLLQTVLQIIYFYNPLLWLANAVIRRVREQAVDEMVQVAMGRKAQDYPETLLSVARLAFDRPALALRFIGVVESKSQLQGRIKKMLNQPIPKTAKLGIAGLLVIILIGATLLPMAAAQKSNTNRQAIESVEHTEQRAKELVEDFFKHNYRDITARETIEWGEPEKDENGNISIRYKYKATIWDKDKIIENKVFTFDENGKYISANSLPGFPQKIDEKNSVAKQVDLLQKYPTTLREKDANPGNARAWKITDKDIFYTPSFKLNIGNDLKVEIEEAVIGIGNTKDGAVWAIIIPGNRGTLNSSANETTEIIEHLWLRFHPAEINNIFRDSNITENEDKSLLEQMKLIANMKMWSSWQAGGKAMIPGRSDMTVDADTRKGPRRFFIVNVDKRTAEYVSAFEDQSVPEVDMTEKIEDDSVAKLKGEDSTSATSDGIPVIVSTTPQAFQNSVSTGLKTIEVTFDEEMMDRSWSWTGGDDTYPKTTGEPRYDRSRKTCRLPVDLEPGRVYWVGINSASYKNFRNKDGVPAPWYAIVFATEDAQGNPTPIPDDMLAEARRINAQAAASGEAAKEPVMAEHNEGSQETNSQTELAYDDGSSAGKWSFSGGGHGVKFTVPSDGCVLKAVKLYGSRYGEYEAPDEDFDVWLCDENFNVIANFKFPYSLFAKRGYTDWITLDVDDVEVPAEFAICLAFDPHQTKGIYVYHDAKSSRRSYQGIPPEMEPFKDGDWMIRALVETPGGKTATNPNPSRAERMEAENLAGEGWKLWAERKLAEAEELFRQAVEKDPTNANAWNGLGWSLQNQGKKENARYSFERCLEIEPMQAAALNGLGWITKSNGQTNKAIEYWKKAVRASGGNATASLSGLTQTYMEIGQYDQAEKYYQMWLKVEPNNEQAKEGLQQARAKQ